MDGANKVFSFGIGNDVSDKLIINSAKRGNGKHYFTKDSDL